MEAKGERKVFIKLMINIYEDIKLATIKRRFYDCRKYYNEKKEQKPQVIKVEKKLKYTTGDFPIYFPRMKIIKLNDILRFKKNINYKFLRGEGYTVDEIDMLRGRGVI